MSEKKKGDLTLGNGLIFTGVGLLIGYLIFSGPESEDYNSQLLYGDSGLPKNCRAIITTSINDYENDIYPAEDIFESIDRNCGEFGHSWEKY